jgi:hypothetical protein
VEAGSKSGEKDIKGTNKRHCCLYAAVDADLLCVITASKYYKYL